MSGLTGGGWGGDLLVLMASLAGTSALVVTIVLVGEYLLGLR
ncbi:hypothetical protein [Methylobacterium sp. ID0610]